MKKSVRGILGRVLIPVFTIIVLSAGSAYLLIEAVVVHEVRLKSEGELRAEGERILSRLRADYALLFHAFGSDPKQFAHMTRIAQGESLGYLERYNAGQSGISVYVQSGGALLVPAEPAEAQQALGEQLFGPHPCEDIKTGCLLHRAGFAPWGWQLALVSQDEHYLKDTRKTVGILLAVITVMALLVGWAVVWVVRKQIHRPLAEILEHLEGVGRGEYAPLNLKGSREIESLAQHLTRMGEQIRRRENEIRQSEERYRRLSEHLEERVNEETRKRAEEQKVMIQNSRTAAMGEMISAVAHQWRQPLNALAVTVQDIEDAWRHGELDEAYLKTNVTRSMNQIAGLSDTIDNFRSFFRPDSEAEPFDLAAAAAQAIELLAAELASHGIDVNFEKPDRTVTLYGYPAQIKQVLINLLINAKDAILLNNVARGHITITLQSPGDRALIHVCDNGGGIPPEIMERIFDPFFSTKEAGKGAGVISGSGVGLYMSKSIIEENFKGRIEAKNRGAGACFTLSIPLDSTNPAV